MKQHEPGKGSLQRPLAQVTLGGEATSDGRGNGDRGDDDLEDEALQHVPSPYAPALAVIGVKAPLRVSPRIRSSCNWRSLIASSTES
jgi:hypothetical protein